MGDLTTALQAVFPMPSAKALFQLMPSVFQLVLNTSFISLGINAIARDYSVKDSPCGQSTHILKYCILNVLFATVNCITYIFWAAGGEGARARAVVLICFHLALATWGIMMFSQTNAHCHMLLNDQWGMIVWYQEFAVFYNSGYFVLVLLHEAILGKYIGNDLTLMPASFCYVEPWKYEEHKAAQLAGKKPQYVGKHVCTVFAPNSDPYTTSVTDCYDQRSAQDETKVTIGSSKEDMPEKLLSDTYDPVIPDGFA